MKTPTKKTILGAIIIGLSVTSLPLGITSYTEKKLCINDVKSELKSLSTLKEKEAAKSLVVKTNGVEYKGSFIPKTDRSVRILTVRLTVYWARGGDTDGDSRKLRSSTGYTLKQGDSVAVDPKIIPYDSEVLIPNVGLVKAVDTGTAVKDKVASHGKMPVIDVFFYNKRDAMVFANNYPKVVKVAVCN